MPPSKVEIDHGILGGHEQIARHYDVRAAKVDDDVAVGVGVRHVAKENRLAIEEEIALRFEERGERQFRDRTSRLGHPREHTLVRDDGGRIAVDGDAGLRDGFVAAGVVRVRVRIDQPANGLVRREPADCREHLGARRRRSAVDDEHAVLAGLHGDVRPRADEHVDVALDVHRLDRRRLRLRCGRQRSERERGETRAYKTGAVRGKRGEADHLAARFMSASSLGTYSGYNVSAPPNTASNGRPNCLAQSSMNGFSPGK